MNAKKDNDSDPLIGIPQTDLFGPNMMKLKKWMDFLQQAFH